MEATLAEALEWLEEWDGATGRTTEEYYEEKLREVEEVCSPIIKEVGRRGWGRGAGLAHAERKLDFW